jgi:hypothetical protein
LYGRNNSISTSIRATNATKSGTFYPNPVQAGSILTVRQSKSGRLHVYNLQGQLIHEGTVYDGKVRIDLNAGHYNSGEPGKQDGGGKAYCDWMLKHNNFCPVGLAQTRAFRFYLSRFTPGKYECRWCATARNFCEKKPDHQ